MIQLIYRIFDMEKVNNAIEEALAECKGLKDSKLSEDEINN